MCACAFILGLVNSDLDASTGLVARAHDSGGLAGRVVARKNSGSCLLKRKQPSQVDHTVPPANADHAA
jgi:hypothetical protein